MLNTEEQCMNESNTLVGNVTIKQLQRDILLYKKGLYVKESNSLAGNVANNFLRRALHDGVK